MNDYFFFSPVVVLFGVFKGVLRVAVWFLRSKISLCLSKSWDVRGHFTMRVLTWCSRDKLASLLVFKFNFLIEEFLNLSTYFIRSISLLLGSSAIVFSGLNLISFS